MYLNSTLFYSKINKLSFLSHRASILLPSYNVQRGGLLLSSTLISTYLVVNAIKRLTNDAAALTLFAFQLSCNKSSSKALFLLVAVDLVSRCQSPLLDGSTQRGRKHVYCHSCGVCRQRRTCLVRRILKDLNRLMYGDLKSNQLFLKNLNNMQNIQLHLRMFQQNANREKSICTAIDDQVRADDFDSAYDKLS